MADNNNSLNPTQDTQVDPAEQILSRVPGVSDDVKADAWDAFHNLDDAASFEHVMRHLDLPEDVRGDLWDAKDAQLNHAWSGGHVPDSNDMLNTALASVPRPHVDLQPDSGPTTVPGLIWQAANKPIGPLQPTIDELNQEANTLPSPNETKFQAAKRIVHSTEAGMFRDALGMITPLTFLTAGSGAMAEAAPEMGEAAEQVPGIIRKAATAAKVVNAGTGAGFAGAGAKNIYDAATDDTMTPEERVKEGLTGTAMLAGGLAGAGASIKSLKGAPAPTPERIGSLDHDAATAAQQHIKEFAQAEHDAASQQIEAVDNAIDEANPNGSVDGRKAVANVSSLKSKLYPQGASPVPSVIDRAVKAAGSSEAKVPAASINDPTGNTQAVVDAYNKGNLTPNSPENAAIIQTLRDMGYLPDESKPWTFSQARQIKSNLQEFAAAQREANPKAAYFANQLAKQIDAEMQSVAEAHGLGGRYAAANNRWSQYQKVFGPKTPLRDMINGTNADEIMSPLSSPGKAEAIRRGLVGEKLGRNGTDGTNYIKQGFDWDNLQNINKFHQLAKEAAKPTMPLAVRNRLKAMPILMIGGTLIGHPYLGLMGSGYIAGQAIGGSMGRGAAEKAFKGLQVTESPHAIPAKPYSPVKPGQQAVPGMLAAAANAAAKTPGKYGKPQFINHTTGQRLKANGDGSYTDVDSGETHDWHHVGGKQ